MGDITKVLYAVLIGFFLLFGSATFVYAEDESDELSDEFTLEEITVTAQKREENLQDVPISMSVVYSEDIQQLGKNSITDILSGVSSLVISKNGDSVSIALRGVSDAIGGDGQASVSINVDGVTSNRMDTGTGMYDVERVEVLYGPQSTLYATSSPGGIINVITASPKLDKYEFSGTLEYGSYDLLHTEGAMNAPIGDSFALRTAFSTSVRDGYLSNGGENEDSKSARMKLLYEPNDRFSAEITAELFKEGGNGYYGGVPSFADQDDVDDPWTGATLGSLGSNDRTREKIYANIKWDTGFGILTLIPSKNDVEGEREEMSAVGNPDTATEFSAQLREDHAYEEGFEVRIESDPDFMFDWIVGYISYESGTGTVSISDEFLETGEGEWADRVTYDTIKSLYANITYPVTDQFRVTVGARKNKNTYDYDQKGMMMQPAISDEPVFVHTIQEMDSPNPIDLKLGAEYNVSENSMVYVDYSSSYRIVNKYRSLSDPEFIEAYTVGAKNRFFDNRLQLNGAAYYYEYENYKTFTMRSAWIVNPDDDLEMDSDETADDSGAATDGDGRMMGFDIEATAILTDKDRLDISVSYLYSEWTDLFFDYDYNIELDVVDGEVVEVEFPDQSYNGEPMFMSPPWTINLTYSHNFSLWNGGSLTTRLESRYQTGYRLTWLETDYPANYQETHHMENISAIYAHPDDKWTLSAYVRNVFDYAEKLRYQSGRGLDNLWISDPRTWGFVLSVKY